MSLQTSQPMFPAWDGEEGLAFPDPRDFWMLHIIFIFFLKCGQECGVRFVNGEAFTDATHTVCNMYIFQGS